MRFFPGDSLNVPSFCPDKGDKVVRICPRPCTCVECRLLYVDACDGGKTKVTE